MRGCWKGTGMLVLLGIPAPCVQSLLSLASLSLIPLAFLPTCPHPCIPHLGVPTHGAGCEQGPCGGQGDKAQETEGPCRTLQASRRRSALQSNGTGHPSCGWDPERPCPRGAPKPLNALRGCPRGARGCGQGSAVPAERGLRGCAGEEGLQLRAGEAPGPSWPPLAHPPGPGGMRCPAPRQRCGHAATARNGPRTQPWHRGTLRPPGTPGETESYGLPLDTANPGDTESHCCPMRPCHRFPGTRRATAAPCPHCHLP